MNTEPRSTLNIPLMIIALSFIAQSAFGQDPGATGPFSVSSQEYDNGEKPFILDGNLTDVEIKASVHHPADLSQGPYPLVVFMHGYHHTCTAGSSAGSYSLSCPEGESPIPNYKGYDYIAEVLAGHGYIVVSVSANDINAAESIANSSAGPGGEPVYYMSGRASLLQHHIDLWDTFNSGGGSLGSQFAGKVDMNNIGTMGHSRGGEGVAVHSGGPSNGLRAVLLLAPSLHEDSILVEDVPLGVILPYCDGDGPHLPGVDYYDDVRYISASDAFAKHAFLVMGANHNFYNTIWTPGLYSHATSDDWETAPGDTSDDPHCGWSISGNGRLSKAEQRGTAIAYIAAFFRTYLGGETQFMDILTGDAPPPPSAKTNDVHVSYHPPASDRLDVNRFDSGGPDSDNTLGGSVSQSDLIEFDICGISNNCLSSYSGMSPHDIRRLKLRWANGSGWYQNELPADSRNFNAYSTLQFRVGVNFEDSPSGQSQDFHVQLRDTAGGTSSVRVSDASEGALYYPPGESGYVPKLMLNTVRIPLSEFSGVNLSNITAIRFNFGQTNEGAVLMSDLALEGDGEARNLAWLIPVINLVLL